MASYAYDDNYGTCVETYATLRIFSDDLSPRQITDALGIEPTGSHVKGEARGQARYKHNVWLWKTEGLVSSRDSRRHLDVILDALTARADQVAELIARKCRIDITHYWLSAGHGGPTLEPAQSRRLAALSIPVWWDVYFSSDPTGED